VTGDTVALPCLTSNVVGADIRFQPVAVREGPGIAGNHAFLANLSADVIIAHTPVLKR
jgi:hypothetical protein